VEEVQEDINSITIQDVAHPQRAEVVLHDEVAPLVAENVVDP